MLSSQDILKEYSKSLLDPIYAIENFLLVDYKTQGGLRRFELFPRQIEAIRNYQNHRHNIVVKARQLGVSTITAAYLAVKYALADPDNTQTLIVLANKEKTATKFLKSVRTFLLQLPRFFWGDEYYGTPEKEKIKLFSVDNNTQLVLPNGSQVVALATSADAFRTYSPTDLVIDEAAFIDKDGKETYSAGMASLGATLGKCYLLSTAHGLDEVFYATYAGSEAGENNYKVTTMRWYEDPRYNKDLQWIKNHSDKNIDIVEDEKDFTFDSYEKRVKDGYKPTSTWYRNMCRDMNNNKQLIAQELDISFIGSGDNPIDEQDIKFYEEQTEIAPFIDKKNKEIWKYKEPIEGRKYITIVDVSRSDGDDFSTVVIIDTVEVEVVLEYKAKVASNILGEIAVDLSKPYNAYIIVDITGGYGNSTIIKILELNYTNVHYSSALDSPITDQKRLARYLKDVEGQKSIPGFQITSQNRPTMMDTFLQYVCEHKLKCKSKRLVNEMKTLIYKDGKVMHKKGHNDDLIMSCAIGLYVMQYSLSKVEKAQEQTKVMLNSWVSSNSSNTPKIDENNPFQRKPNFSPLVSKNMVDPTGEYLWLYMPKRKQ